MRGALATISDDGGAIRFFVGVFVDGQRSAELPAALLARLAVWQIGIDFDIYGNAG